MRTQKKYIITGKLFDKSTVAKMQLPFLFMVCYLITTFFSCKKIVDVDFPKNNIAAGSVFVDQGGANAALAGMYGSIYTTTTSYGYAISLISGIQADELSYNGTTWDQYKNNSLVSNEGNVAGTWSTSYSGIYQANAVIEGVSASNLPDSYKNQVIGESLFIRAFCYFYLVNLYGDVPLVTTTLVSENQLKPRTPSGQVYAQIIADLERAESILPVAYPNAGRTRANKYAASALLARVYLYMKDYNKAEEKANIVIAASGTGQTYNLVSDLPSVFLATSAETIFSFDASVYGYTNVGSQTVPNANVVPTYTILPGLLNAFETGDKRKTNWIGISSGQSYPLKYRTKTKVTTENDVVLRLSEQYLIRSEARARQNNFSGAQEDLNVIRSRAGLTGVSLTSQATALNAIAQERRVELFSEWGHRWLDLKRTGQVDAVIGALKPGLWQTTDALYPIPSGQISINYNLVQNPGYF